MALYETVVIALWAMLPAYVPNNAAVLAGGGKPIDGGTTLGDRRVLGDGKTWRGTAVGVLAGTVVALALNGLAPVVSTSVSVELPTFPLAASVALPTGAMLGDILASFLKRRIGRERGSAVPGLDQLDFVVVSLGLTFLVAPDWFGSVFTLPVLAVVVVVTPLLHLTTNGLAYSVGMKNEPW